MLASSFKNFDIGFKSTFFVGISSSNAEKKAPSLRPFFSFISIRSLTYLTKPKSEKREMMSAQGFNTPSVFFLSGIASNIPLKKAPISKPFFSVIIFFRRLIEYLLSLSANFIRTFIISATPFISTLISFSGIAFIIALIKLAIPLPIRRPLIGMNSVPKKPTF